MAEDNVTGPPEVAAPDNFNKRKLEELEPTELLSDNVAAGESTIGQDTDAENGKSDGIDNASEAKRARLEEGDRAAGNGFEGDKVDDVLQEVGHSPGDGVEECKEVPISGSDEPASQQANMLVEEASHSVGDGLEESKEAPDSESVELAADGQQPPIGIVNAPQEEVSHSIADGLEESKEAPDSASGKPADEAALEPSKGDGNNTVVEVSQKKVDDQPEADMDTVCQKIEVPNNRVGVLIGKSGETIRYLQYNSGAKIQITRDAEADQHSTSRPVELIGTLESIKKAEKLIKDVIAEADAGGSPSLVARGFSTVQAVTGEQVEIQVPNDKVGLIIGKGGETIKSLQTTSGARIQLIPQHPPEGDQSQERTVRITGDRKQIEAAREMIKEAMSQIIRPSLLSGGRGQPAMQPRGPAAPQWGRQGAHPSHFTGYEHQQRGAYASQNQQYPPPYGNYPQSAPRGGYGQSWEQRPHVQGPLPQGNYYGQSQGSDYGQRAPYPRGYGPGYNEGYSGPQEHPYGAHGAPQQTSYPTAGQYPGYGPGEQYGKPSSYGVPPQGQAYGQPRAGEAPYQGSVPPAQSYGSSVPPQQSYPYANLPVQQSFPSYNAVPAADGYSQPQPAAASGPTYAQQAAPPATGYAQPGGQQPTAYAQQGAVSGYSSYPSQQGYAEQPAAVTAAYGYQGQGDAAYAASIPGSATYATQPAVQAAYAPAPGAVQGYDQSVAVSGGYGAPAPAPAAYGQMYAAPR